MQKGILLKTGQLDYQEAWDLQKELHRARVNKQVEDTLVLTEHPHTYTLGKSGHEENLVTEEAFLNRQGIQVYRIDRGGDITYHGPGQIVGYPILDLHNYYLDIGRFLRDLEEVIIQSLTDFGINAGRVSGFTGVWVDGAKIAAIGIKVSRWITMHGFAFNVNTDLSYFANIIPCGISNKPVTSMQKFLRRKLNIKEVENSIIKNFSKVFDIHLSEDSTHSILSPKKLQPDQQLSVTT